MFSASEHWPARNKAIDRVALADHQIVADDAEFERRTGFVAELDDVDLPAADLTRRERCLSASRALDQERELHQRVGDCLRIFNTGGKQPGDVLGLEVRRQPASVLASQLLEKLGLQVDADQRFSRFVLLGDVILGGGVRVRHRARIAHAHGHADQRRAEDVEHPGGAEIGGAREQQRIVRGFGHQLGLVVVRHGRQRLAFRRQTTDLHAEPGFVAAIVDSGERLGAELVREHGERAEVRV